MFVQHSGGSGVKRRRRKACLLEGLELRRLLAAPGELLQYHNDSHSTGNNLSETVLTPGNVNSTTFGLKSRTALDGQVYGQPLLRGNVNITRGASQGLHNVLYVVTQHDSLYALDGETGAVLWQDSFLNLTDPTNLT